ncbi:hypothetical protein B0T11DRAFT_334822 [Plectosphaerella cucumerina]|uniref:Uncharacterized protein n=1 Tax=Plectosphaerella cucumerina TaxID=40658 RepID=A0A8K0TS36_9PEZI|nr:hypothetical protein B0T11DRAFT_334822 [Plectosphaerella cucumerina]
MFSRQLLPALALALSAAAQRPANTSICDFYTQALLKENTGENQYTLLTLLVNTVVIGNYSEVNTGVKVPGILAKGEFDGNEVDLLPYFNGDLKSTNRGGNAGVSVNFLDSGGAEPLKNNKPANDEKSRQFFLLTHLYQFFGSLLGCSQYSMPGFPAYSGDASMYEVHKFMNLDPSEMGYFIQQVALSAQSFGVAEDDIAGVGKALSSLFNVRCAPPTEVVPGSGAQLQSICIAGACPVAENDTCQCYAAAVEPGEMIPSGQEGQMGGECAMGVGSGMGGNNGSTTMPTSAGPAEPTSVTQPAGASVNSLGLGAFALVLASLVMAM